MNQLPGVNQSHASNNTSQSSGNNNKACDNDAKDFSNAVEKKETDKKQKKGNDKGLEKNPDELLRSLKDGAINTVSKGENLEMLKAEANAIQKTNAADAVDKINKIVDRVMVAEASGTKEVKVSFNQDFLAGTDMLIKKEAGKLSIEFSTTSSESFNFLSKGEQNLANQLQNKLGSEASIEIKMQQSDMGQANDGRSRNQFIEEEFQDDDS